MRNRGMGGVPAAVRIRRHCRALLIGMGLSSCVTTNVAPLTDSGHRFAMTPEEKKLLDGANRVYAEFDKKGLLLDEPELQAYVNRIATPLIPASTVGVISFRFRILRMPVANAFAMPNGDIYFTVALLARLESEAEFAQVAAHEIAHTVLRHGLKRSENQKSSMIAAHIADLFLFGTSIAYLPYALSAASFSRENEVEADSWGIVKIAEQGYAPSAALEVFNSMNELKKSEEIEGSAYSSHPTSQERKHMLAAQISALKPSTDGRVGKDAYRSFRNRLMRENLELKLNIRQYEIAADIAKAAAVTDPASAWPLYYAGEAYRLMGEDPKGAAREQAWLYGKRNDLELETQIAARKNEFFDQAIESYQAALKKDRDFTFANRGLGIVQLRKGDKLSAQASLNKYLNSGKMLKDKPYILNLLKETEQ